MRRIKKQKPLTEYESFVKDFPTNLQKFFVDLYNAHANPKNECSHKKPLVET